jgi:cation transport regulator ChaC
LAASTAYGSWLRARPTICKELVKNCGRILPCSAAQNRVVHGLLWTLTEADEKALDRYEGVSKNLYRKVICSVKQEEGAVLVEALVYVASDNVPGPPRLGYLEKIIHAAREHGFPVEYIAELGSWLRKRNMPEI